MRNILYLIIIVLFSAVWLTPAYAASYSFGGSDYWIVESAGISWEDAKVAAEDAGGHLATITSAAEDAFVSSGVLANSNGEYWLGGFQRGDNSLKKPAKGWNWVTGEDWNYNNWFTDEPNNYRGRDEKHLGIWSRYDWKWNDEGYLNNITGYIVESESPPPVPLPAAIWLFTSGLLVTSGLRRIRNR